MRTLVLVLLAVIVSCSGPSSESAKTSSVASVPSHQPPQDLSSKLPLQGQTKMQLVPDHLLGKDFMPGGNLADYKTEAGEFQLFVLELPDAKSSASMLFDWKAAIPDAKYLAHMGGYFGFDQVKPVYIFAKGPFLAGVVGLTQEKADVEARKLAARL